jgi:SAM-dependent methyltransferase
MKQTREKFPPQTIYGSRSRYNWIKKHINKKDVVIDLGCGTGLMITIPLIEEGYNVYGVDLDKKSIDYGKEILKKKDLNQERLICEDIRNVSVRPHVIILSEVLEHISSNQIDDFLRYVYDVLLPGGTLLVTVPNGYGFFEFDAALYRKKWLRKILLYLDFEYRYLKWKHKKVGYNTVLTEPSSLDSSPHVQAFTYNSLPKLLKIHKFKLVEKQGGSFMSGPLTNLFFTGFNSAMKWNMSLGRKLPSIASDFYFKFKKI